MIYGIESWWTFLEAASCGGLSFQERWHLLKEYLKEDVPLIMGHLDAPGVKWVKIGRSNRSLTFQ